MLLLQQTIDGILGSSGNTSALTKLEVGVVGTDVVAGTQQALHHQSSSHGVKQTKVLWDTTFLKETEIRTV